MIILNEKEYAERCLSSGDVGIKPNETLRILAKYYYHHLGYRKKRISTCLIEFMWMNYPGYAQNKKSWNETIDIISKNAYKTPLFENNSIGISESEIKTIDSLSDPNLQRVAFTMLCLAKLNTIRSPQKNGWINNSSKEIFDLAGVNTSKINRGAILGTLRNLGLLEFPRKNGNLSNRVTFIDFDGEIILSVSDFRALGNEYFSYCGDNYIRCERCGLLIRGGKTGRKKYCNNCKKGNPTGIKTGKCIDCGKKLVLKSKDTETCRCVECYEVHRRERKNATQQARRSKSGV